MAIYRRAIAQHDATRRREISEFLSRSKNLKIEKPEKTSDFITVFGQENKIMSQMKIQGRAPCSIDKGPRSTRSPLLTKDEEVFGISTAIIIMYAFNMDHGYSKWSINRVFSMVFQKTKANALLLKKRNFEQAKVNGQVRRWMPFFKLLSEKSKFFTLDTCPVFEPTDHHGTMRGLWMNKMAPHIFHFVKDWIKEGERVCNIIEDKEVLVPNQSMKEWFEMRRKEFDALLTSPDSLSNTTTTTIHHQQHNLKNIGNTAQVGGNGQKLQLSSSFSDDHTMEDAASAHEVIVKKSPLLTGEYKKITQTLHVLDLVRIQTLSDMTSQGKSDELKRKAQAQFMVGSFF